MSEISIQSENMLVQPANGCLNPFPATAVAVLSQGSSEFWSIETEALKQAKSQLNQYLHGASANGGPEASKTKGVILAIIGDYGTGKTHIAQDLLRQINLDRNPKLHPYYLDAPSDTFLALYRDRFIKKLDRAEVLQRVDDYYADIVAKELGNSALTKTVADGLRKRIISPDEVVKKLGLMESKFTRELGAKLKKVTDQPDFGTALLLLRRPEFQAAVWEWLEGSTPDQILQERGITRRIADDATALEAIGVMAFLFGQQGHRFILFIDEIEKVLSHTGPNRPSEAAILALKKLMEAMSQTHAMLIMVGLPEFQEFLPEDAKQRISCVIRPSAINADEISKYVAEAQRRATGREGLGPFTMDAIDYLAEIAGGNTRKMVRLCYHAYIASVDANTNVTRAILREIARDQFELSNNEDVSSEITRYIESRGWLFEKQKVFKEGKTEIKVDYWLPVGDNGAGAVIFLCRSILQEDEVKALAVKAKGVVKKDSAGIKVETILVINGYLADNLQGLVNTTFGKVVTYRFRNFRDDIDSILTGVRIRLEQRDRENVLAVIKQRVDEISRQNRSIDSQLSEFNHRGVGPRELHSAVSQSLKAVFGQIASNYGNIESAYPSVASIFYQVDEIINSITSLDKLFDQFFMSKGDTNSTRISVRMLRKELPAHFVDEVSETIGSFYVLRELIASFKRGVFQCIANSPFTMNKEFDIESIDHMCSVFYELCRDFNLNRLFDNGLRLQEQVKHIQSMSRNSVGLIDKYNIVNEKEFRKFEEIITELPRKVFNAVRNECNKY